jgi:hypothetical protein
MKIGRGKGKLKVIGDSAPMMGKHGKKGGKKK